MQSVRLMIAGAVLIAVAAVAAAAVLLTGDDAPRAEGQAEQRDELRLERTRRELVVWLADGARPPVGPGLLVCVDSLGEVLLRRPQSLLVTDPGVAGGPHLHQRMPPHQIAAVERCTLSGAGPTLDGAAAAG